MVECILKDKKKILPCSVFLQGEYGVRDLFVGVPVKLGARGVEQIIEIKLTAEEDAALKKSAQRSRARGGDQGLSGVGRQARSGALVAYARRVMRAMFEIGISFGQTASHSPSFEQLPKPSASA